MASVRCRAWAFTHFDYTEDDIKFWNEINCKYICYGKEKCPTTQREHLQGFIAFENARRFDSLKDQLPSVVHFEPARGNSKQNREYCNKVKNGEFYERGEPPHQGARYDLDGARDMALNGGMRSTCLVFNAQAIRTAEKALSYCEQERSWKPYVYWFWGEPGTGKSRLAYEIMNVEDDRWQCGDSLKWWDGYDGHPDVIIDDFRDTYCSMCFLLKILDRYPLRVEVKGGHRQLLAKRIIITSPYHPENVYRGSNENALQLTRRIDEIVRCYADTVVETACKHELDEMALTGPDTAVTQKSGVILEPRHTEDLLTGLDI